MVLSDGGDEIDEKRASRIATMIGADGGFTNTSKILTLLNDGQKIMGAQGVWESDIDKYFKTGDIDTSKGGRIAATTVYTSGSSGDYLYRKPANGLPGANSMFTYLDMGGNVK